MSLPRAADRVDQPRYLIYDIDKHQMSPMWAAAIPRYRGEPGNLDVVVDTWTGRRLSDGEWADVHGMNVAALSPPLQPVAEPEKMDDADYAALRLARMLSERDPEHRNRRSEATVLDEQRITAWAMREFAQTRVDAVTAEREKWRIECDRLANGLAETFEEQATDDDGNLRADQAVDVAFFLLDDFVTRTKEAQQARARAEASLTALQTKIRASLLPLISDVASFLDSIEWTDTTSEHDAANYQHALEEEITKLIAAAATQDETTP